MSGLGLRDNYVACLRAQQALKVSRGQNWILCSSMPLDANGKATASIFYYHRVLTTINSTNRSRAHWAKIGPGESKYGGGGSG